MGANLHYTVCPAYPGGAPGLTPCLRSSSPILQNSARRAGSGFAAIRAPVHEIADGDHEDDQHYKKKDGFDDEQAPAATKITRTRIRTPRFSRPLRHRSTGDVPKAVPAGAATIAPVAEQAQNRGGSAPAFRQPDVRAAARRTLHSSGCRKQDHGVSLGGQTFTHGANALRGFELHAHAGDGYPENRAKFLADGDSELL